MLNADRNCSRCADFLRPKMKGGIQMGPSKVGVLGFLLAAVAFVPSAKALISDNIVTVITKDRTTFASGVDHMSGNVSVNQSNFKLKYEAKVFGVLPISTWFDYKRLDINENIPVDLPASLQGYRFGVETALPIPFVNSKEYFIG